MKKVKEIAGVFFRLGCIAFGGPAAHIAMMDEEIVEKRKWMSREHFLDLIGATQLIPGPNSTEMTMHCGHERGGATGLFVAGACFIFPAVAITAVLAHFYTLYGKLPEVQPWIYGIKAAVLAIILSAVYKLGKKALKTNTLMVIATAVFALALLGLHEVYLLLGLGISGGVLLWIIHQRTPDDFKTKGLYILPFLSVGIPKSALSIFFIFLKVGSILYGSGYVLFAYLDAELVSTGLLTRADLVEAIAMGQFTPGPVLSTATFIGYQMGGWSGAIAATVGMFLPSFLFVWILNPLVPKMRSSKLMGFILDSVNAAAVAVMAAVLIEMATEVIINIPGIIIAVISLFMVFGPRKINPAWIILTGAFLGKLLSYIF